LVDYILFIGQIVYIEFDAQCHSAQLRGPITCHTTTIHTTSPPMFFIVDRGKSVNQCPYLSGGPVFGMGRKRGKGQMKRRRATIG
jgi:hypothetical protein